MKGSHLKSIGTILVGSLLIGLFAACIDSPGPSGRFSNSDNIFLDVRIQAEEGNDSASVLIQFHSGADYGPIVGIDTPGYVMLDGVRLAADSSSITGPFYSAFRELNSFYGKHSITVYWPGQKKLKEDFSFQPFRLLTGIGDTVTNKPFNLDFSGLSSRDYVRILLTDTSLNSKGVDRLDTVINNRSRITRFDLLDIEPGPVQMELIRETVSEIRKDEMFSGNLNIFFTIRREFILKDR